jgi:hypothetical protein
MIKRILAMVAAIVLIVISRPVYQVGVELGFWQPFTRPPGVSPRARYVPTLKSSAWFDCAVDRTRDLDVCRAWDDEGRLIAYGNYRLDGKTRAATDKELRPSMVHLYPSHPELAWIYLFGNSGTFSKTLVPVNDTGQPLERFEVHVENGGEK